MKIIYGRTVYVLDCGSEMLDCIEAAMNGWATGTGQFCTTHEDIVSFIEDCTERSLSDEPDCKTLDFLRKAHNQIRGHVGDVIFSR